MKLEALLGLAVPLIYLSLLVVESRYAARPYETIRKWRSLGSLFFVITLVIGSITPQLLPSSYLKSHRLVDLSAFGLWGIPVGVFTITFFGYWLHRAEHRLYALSSRKISSRRGSNSAA